MSRYIEVDHLKKSVEDLPDCYNGFSDTYDKAYIIGLIDEEPTSDVVPVVRCRDCKHKRMVLKSGCLGCDIQCGLHPYDWYCPNGEKVTE